ncbi:MAG: O-antigen ligase family protein [Verrucomicrobia bacterium]|nr:O-antigen ligase family protein [Verrucomicrobiota bacterium]
MKALPTSEPDKNRSVFWHASLSAVAGGTLGLSLLKFGNPVIFEGMIAAPSNFWEYVFQPWPVTWGYVMVAVVAVLTLKAGNIRKCSPGWIPFLPIIWFGWQILSSTQSVSPQLSRSTLWHFGATVAWYYIGLFGLSRAKTMRPFWILVLPAYFLVLWFGAEQHYGGLEATRRMIYEQPNWRELPPAYLKKIASERIFSTLVYPNAFAGVILLFLPFMIPVTWKVTKVLPRIARMVCAGALAYLSCACLLWSGSKAGWLIALAVGLVGLVSIPIPRKAKIAISGGLVVIGLGAFLIRYAPYFEKGATSVSARLDYWRAAATTAIDHPFFGTGPGTFSIPYAKIKRPDSEMARLVHNDYLEQASDSGFIGCAVYVSFVFASMLFLFQRVGKNQDDLLFPIWMGLAGWTIQGMVEFSLYIPALAWPAFTMMGFLFGRCQTENGST